VECGRCIIRRVVSRAVTLNCSTGPHSPLNTPIPTTIIRLHQGSFTPTAQLAYHQPTWCRLRPESFDEGFVRAAAGEETPENLLFVLRQQVGPAAAGGMHGSSSSSSGGGGGGGGSDMLDSRSSSSSGVGSSRMEAAAAVGVGVDSVAASIGDMRGVVKGGASKQQAAKASATAVSVEAEAPEPDPAFSGA